MKLWIPILGGLGLMPIAILVGIGIAYGILYLRRISEHEGRRGFLAALYGIIFGAPCGFYGGFTLAQTCLSTDPRATLQRAVLSGLIALLAITVVFVISFVGGVHWAEARRVTNYAGERAAWSLLYVALPLTFLVGALVFVATWQVLP